MSEQQSKYEYPGTDVLINKLGITDGEYLSRVEHIVTSQRLAELELDPIRGNFDLSHLPRDSQAFI